MTGYIYAIRCMDRVKIGFSSDPARRLIDARVWSPYPVYLLGAIEGCQTKEREYHRMFASQRRHGEWFEISGEVEGFISGLMPVTDLIGKKVKANPDTGVLLMRRRKALGLTQSDLGRAVSAKKFTISRIEKGLQVPTTSLAAALERELSIPASSWVSDQKTESAA